ncbi:MAG: type II CAAX endopeptidase family protein [Vicinamibacterales bacterium]
MSRARVLVAGLVQVLVGWGAVMGSAAAYRFLLHPPIVSALALGGTATTITRRVGVFVLVVAAYWAFGHWYERRPVQDLQVDWRWLLAGGVAGALSIAATIALLSATGHYHVKAVRGLGQAGDVLGLIWVAAVVEELTFRGLLLRICEERLGTRWALALTALVFSLAHFANNGFKPMTVVAVTLTGLMWSGVYLASRSLWVAAAHHCCWNATIFLSGLPLSGQEEWRALAPLVTDYSGAVLWSGGAFGPEDSLVSVIVTAGVSIALWRSARAADATFPRPAMPV